MEGRLLVWLIRRWKLNRTQEGEFIKSWDVYNVHQVQCGKLRGLVQSPDSRFWILQSAGLYFQMSLRCWSPVQYLLSVGGCSPIDRTLGFYISSKPEFIRPLFEDTVIWAEWLCTRPPHKFHCILICT